MNNRNEVGKVRQVLQILAMFLAVQLLGLFTGVFLLGMPELQEVVVTPAEPSSILNSLLFLVYVVIGAVFMILLLKFYRGVMLFKLLEAGIIFIASNVVFFALFYQMEYGMELSLLCSGALVVMKFFYPQLKNATAIISSAGVGALFGFSLGFIPAVFFAVGLSAYDVISVFWTKHMVMMAQEFSQRQLSFSVSAPGRKKKRKGEKLTEEEQMSLELGTGDMAIPLMLAVSAYKVGGVEFAAAIIVGSALGLLAVLFYVMQKRAFLPALPPISLGGILALLVLVGAKAVVG